MQTLKRYFYQCSLILSGSCLVMMALLILLQIGARTLGVVIPSSEDFAGWLLSATVFFGLAYTFNSGGHIRVTILLTRLGGVKRRYIENFNVTAALLISGYMMFYCLYTAYESYDYQDVTDTYLVMPLWLVQAPMALGTLFLFLAVFDSFCTALSGKTPNYITHEDSLGNQE
ncbi:MAG: TRAP transporter small permease [Oceanospirillaceae bacterium]|nr:TRAP transporter small permease [Oceanospirillaceae bacterium]